MNHVLTLVNNFIFYSDGSNHNNLQCVFNPVAGNLMVTDGTCVGLRKDLNGIYLLKTALQTAVEQTRDREISLEMTLPDVRCVPSGSVIWRNTLC